MISNDWQVVLFILSVLGSFGVPYLGIVLFDRLSGKLRHRKQLKDLEERRLRNEANN